MRETLTDLETALVFQWAQICDGDAPCEYCAEPATLTYATGADPEQTPVCFDHWRDMATFSMTATSRLFGRNALDGS